jgi:hypothetical protein
MPLHEDRTSPRWHRVAPAHEEASGTAGHRKSPSKNTRESFLLVPYNYPREGTQGPTSKPFST